MFKIVISRLYVMDTENLEDFANKVANYLKVNGKFDEFRKKCASEIEQHVSCCFMRPIISDQCRAKIPIQFS